MVEARYPEDQIAARQPRFKRRQQQRRSVSSDKLIQISKMTFEMYLQRLIMQDVGLEQVRDHITLYAGNENKMRQGLVKQLIAKKGGNLSTINEEVSIDFSLLSYRSVNEPQRNNDLITATELDRQRSFRSE